MGEIGEMYGNVSVELVVDPLQIVEPFTTLRNLCNFPLITSKDTSLQAASQNDRSMQKQGGVVTFLTAFVCSCLCVSPSLSLKDAGTKLAKQLDDLGCR